MHWRPKNLNFGTWPGSKNAPKINPWPKKCCQEPIFYRIFTHASIFQLSGSLFIQFLMKIEAKNNCIFSFIRAFFKTWRHPKNMHRRSVLSTLRFFEFSKICNRIPEKMHQKWHPQKTSKIDAQEVPKST